LSLLATLLRCCGCCLWHQRMPLVSTLRLSWDLEEKKGEGELSQAHYWTLLYPSGHRSACRAIFSSHGSSACCCLTHTWALTLKTSPASPGMPVLFKAVLSYYMLSATTITLPSHQLTSRASSVPLQPACAPGNGSRRRALAYRTDAAEPARFRCFIASVPGRWRASPTAAHAPTSLRCHPSLASWLRSAGIAACSAKAAL